MDFANRTGFTDSEPRSAGLAGNGERFHGQWQQLAGSGLERATGPK
jgi:hypothetical protein